MPTPAQLRCAALAVLLRAGFVLATAGSIVARENASEAYREAEVALITGSIDSLIIAHELTITLEKNPHRFN